MTEKVQVADLHPGPVSRPVVAQMIVLGILREHGMIESHRPSDGPVSGRSAFYEAVAYWERLQMHRDFVKSFGQLCTCLRAGQEAQVQQLEADLVGAPKGGRWKESAAMSVFGSAINLYFSPFYRTFAVI